MFHITYVQGSLSERVFVDIATSIRQQVDMSKDLNISLMNGTTTDGEEAMFLMRQESQILIGDKINTCFQEKIEN